MTKITVGMPVYNGEEFIREAIESILFQNYEDFELLISDNASTDNTEKICREYEKADRRVKYFRNSENKGASFNYNLVFELSTSPYFKWAAHDDICRQGFLKSCIELFEGSDDDTVVCYPSAEIIAADGMVRKVKFTDLDINQKSSGQRLKYLILNLKECNMVHGLIRKSALEKTRLIGSFFASDVILLIELALQGKIRRIDEKLFCRRIHPGNSRKANRSYEEVAVWFDPKNRGKVFMPLCQLQVEMIRSILNSDISLKQKGRCLEVALFYWQKRYWRHMGGELKLAIKDVFRKNILKDDCQVNW